jgi:hypothetical protein
MRPSMTRDFCCLHCNAVRARCARAYAHTIGVHLWCLRQPCTVCCRAYVCALSVCVSASACVAAAASRAVWGVSRRQASPSKPKSTHAHTRALIQPVCVSSVTCLRHPVLLPPSACQVCMHDSMRVCHRAHCVHRMCAVCVCGGGGAPHAAALRCRQPVIPPTACALQPAA